VRLVSESSAAPRVFDRFAVGYRASRTVGRTRRAPTAIANLT
jgi:hypothetical protein